MTIKVTDSNLLSEVQKGITLVDFWAPGVDRVRC